MKPNKFIPTAELRPELGSEARSHLIAKGWPSGISERKEGYAAMFRTLTGPTVEKNTASNKVLLSTPKKQGWQERAESC